MLLTSQDLFDDSIDRFLSPHQVYRVLLLQLLPHAFFRQLIEVRTGAYAANTTL